MKLLFLLLAIGVAAYVLYDNLTTDPQATHLDGWQTTGKTRRPDMPAPRGAELDSHLTAHAS